MSTNIEEKGCKWPTLRIPDSCKGVDIIVGIDEAGRGPVLGPLVYACAFWPATEHDAISKMNFNDSKQLKEGERDGLLQSIIDHPSIGWIVEEITAVDISENMMRAHPISLNTISYDAVARMLKRIVTTDLDNPPQITDVFVDTVGDPAFYKQKLVNALGIDFANNYIIEKKADATYKVVSAASIVAKVTRDSIVTNWKWVEPTVTLSKNYGSGYPGDEKCVQWLAQASHPVFGYPNMVRFSWSTAKEALEKSGAAVVTFECDEEEQGNTDIKDFFRAAPAAGDGAGGNKRELLGDDIGTAGDAGAGANVSKKKARPMARQSQFFQHRKMHHVSPGELFT